MSLTIVICNPKETPDDHTRTSASKTIDDKTDEMSESHARRPPSKVGDPSSPTARRALSTTRFEQAVEGLRRHVHLRSGQSRRDGEILRNRHQGRRRQSDRKSAPISKKAFEDGISAAQDLASAKTMTELFEKQTVVRAERDGRLDAAGEQDERDLRRRRQGHHRAAGARASPPASDAMKSFSLA